MPWRCTGKWIYRSLDFSTSWRWVVSFTPQGKSPLYPFNRRLGGPQASLDDIEKWQFFTLPGLELQPCSHPTRSQSPARGKKEITFLSFKGQALVIIWRKSQGNLTYRICAGLTICLVLYINVSGRNLMTCLITGWPQIAIFLDKCKI
jgi:hypothetical protein